MLKASTKDLNHLLGNIDLYLLDQVLKARFDQNDTILDAGCGEGRNLVYFIRHDYQAWGIDRDEDSIQMLKYLAKSLNRDYPQDRFTSGLVEELPFQEQQFDAVISSAVLHFAENDAHFEQMVAELNRVLKKGGMLFLRMTTIIGIEELVKPLGDGKYLLPDESLRYLLTREKLNALMDTLQGSYVDPFKTVLVDQQRSMCSLVLQKGN